MKKYISLDMQDLLVALFTIFLLFIFNQELYLVFLIKFTMQLLKRYNRNEKLTNWYLFKTLIMSIIFAFIHSIQLVYVLIGLLLKEVYSYISNSILEYK